MNVSRLSQPYYANWTRNHHANWTRNHHANWIWNYIYHANRFYPAYYA
ncbi:hypothetical protein SLEP1_g54857 [Rubroshorea leprosula]|uniref:Uncharacterized protein n=1 Tax=Rubroshorea leprosula TaxID=152421 RepID=A0AAV5MEP8_9ROSI|nr:hypothetical protein SLEP1_g54857 [Rubroshorea leprosula]